jgi:hypothetical protein
MEEEPKCSFILHAGVQCTGKVEDRLEIPVEGRGVFKGHVCGFHIYTMYRIRPTEVLDLLKKNRLKGKWTSK